MPPPVEVLAQRDLTGALTIGGGAIATGLAIGLAATSSTPCSTYEGETCVGRDTRDTPQLALTFGSGIALGVTAIALGIATLTLGPDDEAGIARLMGGLTIAIALWSAVVAAGAAVGLASEPQTGDCVVTVDGMCTDRHQRTLSPNYLLLGLNGAVAIGVGIIGALVVSEASSRVSSPAAMVLPHLELSPEGSTVGLDVMGRM